MKSSVYSSIVCLLVICLCISMISLFLAPELLADTEKKENKKESKKESKKTDDSGVKFIKVPKQKYTGKRGDFIFHEADIKDVIYFFAKTYKFNTIIDPGISGKVTCRLINVRWDHALDLILRQHGLMAVKEDNGNVIYPKQLTKSKRKK